MSEATYHDLEIELDTCCCGKTEIRVLRSSFDRPRARFQLDAAHRERLEKRVQEFSSLLLEGEGSSRRRELAEEIGRELYELLFPAAIRRSFERSYDALRGGDGLRIRLSFGREYNRSLGGLPWELLCLPDRGRFIAKQPRTSVARYLDLSERIRPLDIQPPLKILVAIASPDPETSAFYEYESLDIAAHQKVVEHALAEARYLEPTFLHKQAPEGRTTLSALHKELGEARRKGAPYHALHLLCHGGFDDHDEGALFFETDDGSESVVTGRQLAQQLTDEVSLVLLASCKTGQVPVLRKGGQHAFAGVASAMVAAGVPAVVAMQFTVSVGAAESFVAPFYSAIDANLPLDDAVSEGRLEMEARGQTGDVEWATPVLFLRAFDGRVLDLKVDEIPRRRIAIYNTAHSLGDDELRHVHLRVDLCDLFANRRPSQAAAWNGEILDALRQKLAVRVGRWPTATPIHLLLAAPLSVAFASGFFLAANERRTITLRQRDDDWCFDGTPRADAPQWLDEEAARQRNPQALPLAEAREPGANHVAVVIEGSRPALPAVEQYLASQKLDPPRVGHVVLARMPRTGHFVVQDGAHAHALAAELTARVDKLCRTLAHPTVHLFLAGPNGLAFALGQLFRVIPRIQLYEYDFENRRHGSYEPSIRLESPAMGAPV